MVKIFQTSIGHGVRDLQDFGVCNLILISRPVGLLDSGLRRNDRIAEITHQCYSAITARNDISYVETAQNISAF